MSKPDFEQEAFEITALGFISHKQAASHLNEIWDKSYKQGFAAGEAAERERECETCKGDEHICAEVPSLRHCEKANREAELIEALEKLVKNCGNCNGDQNYHALDDEGEFRLVDCGVCKPARETLKLAKGE